MLKNLHEMKRPDVMFQTLKSRSKSYTRWRCITISWTHLKIIICLFTRIIYKIYESYKINDHTWLEDWDLGRISVKQLLSLLWFNLFKLLVKKLIISSSSSFSAASEAFFQSPGKLLNPSTGHKHLREFSRKALVSLSEHLPKSGQLVDVFCCLLLIVMLLNLKSSDDSESMAAFMSLSSMVSCSFDQIELKTKKYKNYI